MIAPRITLCIPFYLAAHMLELQAETFVDYPDEFRVIVVDDGSPVPAQPILRAAKDVMGDRLSLYRVDKDIPWNRNGCRNLASREATTDWLLHVDIDHILPAASAAALLDLPLNPKAWYRFPRWRVGKADDTRMKDSLPRDCDFGQVKPHGDSYLCTREQFMRIQYDEDYVGSLGGGSPFLAQMEADSTVAILPESVCLHVHTRDSVCDASISTLSRDTSRYSAMRKLKERTGDTKAKNPLRFPWHRVL